MPSGAPPATLDEPETGPYLVVLGIAQDGGVPQTGSLDHPAWDDPELRRSAVSLAVVEPQGGSGPPRRWLFEATPDLKLQLHRLDRLAPVAERPGLDGIFLTHAHIGHYAGLLLLGFESMGSQSVPVYAMPRMASFLRSNGPWDQLVRYENVEIRELVDGETVVLSEQLRVTPFLVPHRQEYSEVVGYRVDGPRRSVLFIPDINSWEEWDGWGVRIEERLADVDLAYLDGCFYSEGEVPGRDMSGFPHPLVSASLRRFESLAPEERAKIRFIHLNHTNPLHDPESEARGEVTAAGFEVAEELERVGL